MEKLGINKNLLPMKAQYFLSNGGLAGVFSFLPIYARQLGFSSVVVGIIYTVLSIAGTIAKPLFGLIADHFRLQKTLFIFLQAATALTLFVIQFIPEIPSEMSVTLNCSSSTHLSVCKNGCKFSNTYVESSNNATIFCQLHCMTQHKPELLQQIWAEWKLSDHTIKQNGTMAELPFTAEISLYNSMQNDKCFHFPVHRIWLEEVESALVCEGEIATKCLMICSDIFHRLLSCDTHILGKYQFWLFFLLMIVANTSKAVVTSVGDAICFQLLENKPSDFGKQRVWGTIGWGIFAIFSGFLVDKFSNHPVEKDYTVMFYLTLILFLSGTAISYSLKCSQLTVNRNIIQHVRKLFSEIPIVIFMLWCIFVGMATGLQWQFLFWHLEDLISAGKSDMPRWIKTLEGLIGGVRCFGGELPFFFLAGSILRKIGHENAMSLVLFAFGVRFVLYSIITNPWWCLPVELLQGLTFGIFYTTMASHASIVAPAGTETTVQGLVGALFEGVGVSLGSFIGGITYDKYGGVATFRGFGIAAFIIFLLHVLAHKLMPSIFQKQSQNISKGQYASPRNALSALES